MLSSDKAFIQAYNCHAAVDADSQVILLAQVSQTAADQGQLLPLVEPVTLDQGVAPQMVRADAGYWKESEVERLEINDIEPFVAPKRGQALAVAADEGATWSDSHRLGSQRTDAAHAEHAARTSE